MSDTKFQQWLMDHQPKHEMLWKESFWNTHIFWRDTILPMFAPKTYMECEEEFPYKEYGFERASEEYNKLLDTIHDVVGEHWSKSILNPCVKLVYKGVTFVFRYNFYDYEIAVIGDVPLFFPDGFVYSERSCFFYQGFPEEYKITERYRPGATTFIAGLLNHYQFYAFMVMAKAQIDVGGIQL